MDRSELVSEFEDMGLSIPDSTIDDCIIVCITHKITPSDFVGSWVAYCATAQIDANVLDKDKLNSLIKTFKIEDEYKITEKKYSGRNSIDIKPDLKELQSSLNSSASTKNTRGTDFIKIENEFSVSNIIDGGADIKQENSSSGDVACDFGRGNVVESSPSISVESLQLSNQESWKNFIFGQVNYRRFDDHVRELVDDIVQRNDLPGVSPLSDMHLATDETQITISGSLKLIKKEMFLSSPYGYVKLDFSEAGHVQPLFMNQIAVVVGTNPGTEMFKVRKIFTNASLPLPTQLPSFCQGNLNMMIAAGPFFSESSPHGVFLKNFIQKAIESRASVVVLLGPLFESDFGAQLNKATSDGLQKCYDDIMEAILSPLFSNTQTHNAKVVLLSSWKDAASFACYPTPPNVETRLPNVFPGNVFAASDPTVFTIDNITVAANASDAIMDLHVSSINQSSEELFTKLCKQLVWQRSLHPSYTASPTVPVDQLLWLEHCSLKRNTPHVILTSSQLRTFIRVVEGCLVVNVGQLVKHNSQKQHLSGTYGNVRIAPPDDGKWSVEKCISAQVLHI
ncbi:DNA polymerase alpha subunit B-like isoform X7 [Adelges cooleyi]|uniref:DNA polymerase alpha subunit B-like isoform X4 n=1 Tax=Adelges cooleyi TaxID=133065 RepID=UPI00217FF6D6|nr:DNA polymerase alpha subunit B-like isoform X4 [Adelges cooleyi]XP_050425502.1 DNA polymerase alpha subunit B-like isoform X6 [Adelges cooleyi]XP_050425504.1 DNA polymerase alpha subunit B-like isoform X7 [Adelges cooleyi]